MANNSNGDLEAIDLYEEYGLSRDNEQHQKLVNGYIQTHKDYQAEQMAINRKEAQVERLEFFSWLGLDNTIEKEQRYLNAVKQLHEAKRVELVDYTHRMTIAGYEQEVSRLKDQIDSIDTQLYDYQSGFYKKTQQLEEEQKKLSEMEKGSIGYQKQESWIKTIEEAKARDYEKIQSLTTEKAECSKRIKELENNIKNRTLLQTIDKSRHDLHISIDACERDKSLMEAAKKEMDQAKEKLDKFKNNQFLQWLPSYAKGQSHLQEAYDQAKSDYDSRVSVYNNSLATADAKAKNFFAMVEQYSAIDPHLLRVDKEIQQLQELMPDGWEKTTSPWTQEQIDQISKNIREATQEKALNIGEIIGEVINNITGSKDQEKAIDLDKLVPIKDINEIDHDNLVELKNINDIDRENLVPIADVNERYNEELVPIKDADEIGFADPEVNAPIIGE